MSAPVLLVMPFRVWSVRGKNVFSINPAWLSRAQLSVMMYFPFYVHRIKGGLSSLNLGDSLAEPVPSLIMSPLVVAFGLDG